MNQLSIIVANRRACSVITLCGELDVVFADRLRQALDEAIAGGHTRLVVDVANLTFCDLVGLRTLLEAHRRATAAGGWLRLAYVHGPLKRILTVGRRSGAVPGDADLMVIMTR